MYGFIWIRRCNAERFASICTPRIGLRTAARTTWLKRMDCGSRKRNGRKLVKLAASRRMQTERRFPGRQREGHCPSPTSATRVPETEALPADCLAIRSPSRREVQVQQRESLHFRLRVEEFALNHGTARGCGRSRPLGLELHPVSQAVRSFRDKVKGLAGSDARIYSAERVLAAPQVAAFLVRERIVAKFEPACAPHDDPFCCC